MSVRFDHAGLVAADPAACAAFYVDLLGGREEAGPGHAFVVAGEVRLAISPRAPHDPAELPRAIHLGLRVPASLRSHLVATAARRGAASEEVRGRLYVRDADGNVVEFLFD